MNDFKKGGFRKGGGSFGGRPKFGGDRKFGGKFGGGRDGGEGSFGRPEMFPAVCADCGKSCEVPFRPNGIRPVYCRDCFGNQEEGPRQESRVPERYGREARPQFVHANAAGRSETANEEVKRQLTYLEKKLDRILEILVKQEKPHAASAKVAPVAKEVVKESPKAPEKSAEKPAKEAKAKKEKPAAKSAKVAPKKAKSAKK